MHYHKNSPHRWSLKRNLLSIVKDMQKRFTEDNTVSEQTKIGFSYSSKLLCHLIMSFGTLHWAVIKQVQRICTFCHAFIFYLAYPTHNLKYSKTKSRFRQTAKELITVWKFKLSQQTDSRGLTEPIRAQLHSNFWLSSFWPNMNSYFVVPEKNMTEFVGRADIWSNKQPS